MNNHNDFDQIRQVYDNVYIGNEMNYDLLMITKK